MSTNFRREDRENLNRFCAALRADVFGAQPEMSVAQVAAALNSGSDDPFGVTEAILYKALEGQRKIPPHKLGRLKDVTGGRAVMDEVCRQAGGLFVDVNEMELPDEAGLQATFREFSEFFNASLQAYSDDHDFDQVEAAQVKTEAMQAASMIISFALRVEARAAERRLRGMA